MLFRPQGRAFGLSFPDGEFWTRRGGDWRWSVGTLALKGLGAPNDEYQGKLFEFGRIDVAGDLWGVGATVYAPSGTGRMPIGISVFVFSGDGSVLEHSADYWASDVELASTRFL